MPLSIVDIMNFTNYFSVLSLINKIKIVAPTLKGAIFKIENHQNFGGFFMDYQ